MIESRNLRWAGYITRMEEVTNSFKLLTGKYTGKRPLCRLRHRCEDSIRMDLKEIDINTRNLIHSN